MRRHAIVLWRLRGGGGDGGEKEVGIGVRRGPGGLDAAAPDQARLQLEKVGKIERLDGGVKSAQANLRGHQVARARRRGRGCRAPQRSHGVAVAAAPLGGGCRRRERLVFLGGADPTGFLRGLMIWFN